MSKVPKYIGYAIEKIESNPKININPTFIGEKIGTLLNRNLKLKTITRMQPVRKIKSCNKC